MTNQDRPMSMPSPIIDAMLPRLGLAWWGAATARSLSLTWATLRLWNYPNLPQKQPGTRAASSGPG